MASDARERVAVGINYPWKNYGWDFGLAPVGDDGAAWGPRAAWRATIDAELAAFRRLGIFAVRWFVLADGLSYGTGSARPHPDPARPGQWRFDAPPALDAEFEEDFAFLLERCRDAGIGLLPSLIDFRFCYASMAGPGGVIKQGRSDVINDPAKRRIFLDRVLGRLLAVSGAYHDVIYAWELINEPEWCTQGSLHGWEVLNQNKTVSMANMLAFLGEGIGRINQAGFKSTVGMLLPTLKDWNSPGLGVTLHQAHYYGDPAELPEHTYDPRWPVIIGEFATAPHRPWAELPSDAQDVYHRLRHIQSKGYPAAFPWSADSTPDTASPPVVDWSKGTQDLVLRYTDGR